MTNLQKKIALYLGHNGMVGKAIIKVIKKDNDRKYGGKLIKATRNELILPVLDVSSGLEKISQI